MFSSLRAGGLAAGILTVSLTFTDAGYSQSLTTSALNSSVANSSSSNINFLSSTSAALPPAFSAELDAPQTLFRATREAPAAAVEPSVSAAIAPVAAVSPVTPARASLAQLVAAHRSSAIPDRERECLAGAIYFESKGEPLPGQVAVGQVIANRAKSGRFPASFCGVVFQRSQFSFVRGRAMPPIPRSSAHWKTAVAVAHIVANGLTQAVAPKSLFFHARYVSPNWKRMSKVATVGNHVFYR